MTILTVVRVCFSTSSTPSSLPLLSYHTKDQTCVGCTTTTLLLGTVDERIDGSTDGNEQQPPVNKRDILVPARRLLFSGSSRSNDSFYFGFDRFWCVPSLRRRTPKRNYNCTIYTEEEEGLEESVEEDFVCRSRRIRLSAAR